MPESNRHFITGISAKIMLIIFFAAPFLVTVPTAEAIPAFSKKYEAACSLCHDSWPRLNAQGTIFKLNGYQLPDSEDGGETAKQSPEENLFLDIGPANPPLSLLLEGGIVLIQPSSGPEGEQEDKFFCCVEGNVLTLEAGGTVAPNIGFWGSMLNGIAKEAYIRFVNIFGPGYMSVDLGAMRILDHDVAGTGRDFFGTPLVAIYGSPHYPNPVFTEKTTAIYNDTGIRFYGRPNYGRFTYEVGVFTGSHITFESEDDADLAYTLMGRADIGNIAASLRYWTNKSGNSNHTMVNKVDNTYFHFNDWSTDQIILSARYTNTHFSLDFTFDKASFSIGEQTVEIYGDNGAIDTTASPFSVDRMSFSVGAIWFVNKWFETGVTYGLSQYDEYTQTINGVATQVEAMDIGLFQLRTSIIPAANMKVNLEVHIDTSGSSARQDREKNDGSLFDAQNKLLLQWELSI